MSLTDAVVLVPGKDKPLELKTDKEGGFTLPSGKGGLYGIRARHVEDLFAIRRRLLARHPHDLTPF